MITGKGGGKGSTQGTYLKTKPGSHRTQGFSAFGIFRGFCHAVFRTAIALCLQKIGEGNSFRFKSQTPSLFQVLQLSIGIIAVTQLQNSTKHKILSIEDLKLHASCKSNIISAHKCDFF
ncbi:hypothetical protein V2J09_007214 [Rumex salicifolius]